LPSRAILSVGIVERFSNDLPAYLVRKGIREECFATRHGFYDAVREMMLSVAGFPKPSPEWWSAFNPFPYRTRSGDGRQEIYLDFTNGF
jgi:hypothetical protein